MSKSITDAPVRVALFVVQCQRCFSGQMTVRTDGSQQLDSGAFLWGGVECPECHASFTVEITPDDRVV